MNTIAINSLSVKNEKAAEEFEGEVYALKLGKGHRLFFVETNLEDLFIAQHKKDIESGDMMKVVPASDY